jgi:hypothetical protein
MTQAREFRPTEFAHACRMGLEGIVSKAQRLTLPLRRLQESGQLR